MEGQAAIVPRLYAALAACDGDAMAECYADDGTFSDPVFPALRGPEVGAMWRMLCAGARDLTVELQDVQANGERVAATWRASYLFSRTGRRVVNVGHATFTLRRGRIVSHVDEWDFPAWAAQALGWKGKVFGHTRFLQRKVQQDAARRLAEFRLKAADGSR